MELKDPIVIYTGESNNDAWAAMRYLDARGVEAYVVENNSAATFTVFGGIPGIHQPQVYVSKEDAPHAKEMLDQFIALAIKRNQNLPTKIQAECEKCHKVTEFSSSLDGTVQMCPHCRAYMEVGEFEDFEEFADFDDSLMSEDEL